MSGTAERRRLGCSRRGDAISIGWRLTGIGDREPITEFITSLGTGKVLKAQTVFEIDKERKTRYDYLWANTKDCFDANLGGGFMRLECVEGGILPAQLLQPVYDLCARLPHPQIWYDRYNWPKSMFSRGEYSIEEPRAVLGHKQSNAVFGSREFAGTSYPSYPKVLGILEELTTPGAAEAREPMNTHDQIIRMIEYDAFFISTHPGRTNAAANWELAQQRMAARVIWYMGNNPFTDIIQDRWLDISGPLEMPNGHRSIDELGKLDRVDRFHLLASVLSLLKADDRLHLVRAGIPVDAYLNGVMTWSKHRPDDG
jgi:hypothetical protein